MQTTTIAGGFSDVTFHMGWVYVAHMDAGFIKVDRWDGTTFTPTQSFACEGNGFPRLRSVDGSLWLQYRPQDGHSIEVKNLSNGTARSHAGVFYNWPDALGEVGYCVNSFGTGVCEIWHYDGELANSQPALPGTGVAYLTGFNNPISIDDNRASVPGMFNPERTDGLIAGEGIEGGVACLYQDTVTKTIAPGTYTNAPRIAKHPTEPKWAIVATDQNYQTVTLWYDITAADFGDVTVPPVEPPVPPVEPPPVTPPAYTHVLYLEPGEAVLTMAVAKRSGAMLRRL